MLANSGRVLQVLLIEDSAGDVRLTREAFRDANRDHRFARGVTMASKR
jgi:hypothetical protein